MRLNGVWRDALPLRMHHAEIELRRCISLRSCFEIPESCLFVVSGHSLALVKHVPQTCLGGRKTQHHWVDLEGRKAWIHPDEAKARKAIAVPLSAAAVAVLKEQLAQKRKEQYRDFVFVYRGRPVTQVNGKAWKGALKRVGIEELVRRYAHLSADHLASYVDRASGLRPAVAGEVATLGLQ